MLEESLGFNKHAFTLLTFSSSSTLEKCHSSPWSLKMSSLEEKHILGIILSATYPTIKIKNDKHMIMVPQELFWKVYLQVVFL